VAKENITLKDEPYMISSTMNNKPAHVLVDASECMTRMIRMIAPLSLWYAFGII
jgi:hypothetical protein